MYEVSHQLYLEVWQRLMDEIAGREFFAGNVSVVAGNVDCKLTCTLIVGYDQLNDAGCSGNIASKITPVWWEFHTTEGNEEMINDFSFREMCQAAAI